jgi:multiple antibiotic resistance protein
VIYQSTLTGGLLAVGFVFLGRAIFRLLGIAIGDFMIAGGSILFCIAIIDLVSPPSEVRRPNAEPGAVPLGTPLIAGPAVLTTSLAIIEEYGLWATLISVVLNVALCGALLGLSDALLRFLGRSGSRALSKITSLLLGAIAVMLIRKGVMDLLGRL